MDKEYWEKKAEESIELKRTSIVRFSRVLDNLYKTVTDNVNEQLYFRYLKYSENGNIDLIKIKKKLTEDELINFKKILSKHKAIVDKDEVLKVQLNQYKRKLDNFINRKSVSREEEIKMLIESTFVEFGMEEDELYTEELDDIYTIAYDKESFNLAIALGVWFFMLPSDAKKEKFKFWQGGNYRTRLWKNINIVVNDINTAFFQGVALNKDISEISEAIESKIKTAKNRSLMLQSTEISNTYETAKTNVVKSHEIDRFRYVSSLWERTCGVCASMDGMVFRYSDMQVGINHPPMHPRCACTSVPMYDDGFVEEYERFAKTKEGWIKVPSTMTYEDWQKKYGIQL